jgi:alpha-beta hydrolase superfamily lysophospholipase
MGGALTLAFLLHNRPLVNGTVISGPAINVHADPNYSEATRAAGRGKAMDIFSPDF